MKQLAYSDVALVPRMAVVNSRSQCNTSARFLGKTFAMPVMPANMKCSIDFDMAKQCSDSGLFYALHRFYLNGDVFTWVEDSQDQLETISISVGIQDSDLKFLHNISKRGLRVDFITVDVAHGHCLKMKEFLSNLENIGLNAKIIAGNVATPEAVKDLGMWGADAVKVGIGQGRVCTTRLQTGFGLPMFSCVLDCARPTSPNNWHKIPIIADGGVKYNGDVAKALVAGGSMVMVGSEFARCYDSPAETFRKTETTWSDFGPETHSVGPKMKRWYGSASQYNKGSDEHVEGVLVEERMSHLSYGDYVKKSRQALQSAISYAGGRDLAAFNSVEWREV